MGPEYDIRCSKSCTRAGVAVLVLAALAISFLRPLEKARELEGLLTYTQVRLYMKEELDRLESDRAWKHLKNEIGPPLDETWNIARLLEYKVKLCDPEKLSGPVGTEAQKPNERKNNQPNQSLAPAAPSNLVMCGEEPIQPIHSIAGLLTTLADSKMLNRARSYSYRHNLAIYNWGILWYRIDAASYTEPRNVPKSIPPSVFALTLPNLVQLVNHNLPAISDVEALYKEQASITLPSLGMPIGLVSATLFVEIGLMLSIFYFWIWFREAAASENFPTPGTLFGALARSLLSRSIFLFLIAAAPSSSVLLAVKSYWSKPENSIFALLVMFLALVALKEAWTFIFRVPCPFSFSTVRNLISRIAFLRLRSGETLTLDESSSNGRPDIGGDEDTRRGSNTLGS